MSLTDTALLDLPSEYKIHELVFINSGSNHYVRLPVDQHAALLSDNNSGKTSTLSAIKLFVLPEVSFKKCKDKFGFSSGGKFYSDMDSFQYYFPGTESYIICSASNPKGKFCWILNRTTDFGYERIAVPRAYDEIEHLFWNKNSAKNEQAGQLQPNIGITYIKKVLNKQYKGIIFTDRNMIGEAIYTRTSNVDDHTCFSLLPMAKKFTPASVETVRALFGMAFSLGNALTTTLPAAIGSIIDGMGMSAVKKNDDGVFLDLDNALEEWRELKEKDAQLSKVDSLKGDWESLQTERSHYFQLKGNTVRDFKSLVWAIKSELNSVNGQLLEAQDLAGKAGQQLAAFQPQFNAIKDNYFQCEGDIKNAEKNARNAASRIQNADSARHRFLPFCDEDDKNDAAVMKALDKEFSDCKVAIQGLEDREKAIAIMDRLNQSIHQSEKNLKDLNAALSSAEEGNSFLDSLPPHTAAVLLSLNPGFSELAIDPSKDQFTKMDMFATLFACKDETLTFCESPMMRIGFKTHNAEDVKTEIKKQVRTVTKDIEAEKDKLWETKQNISLSIGDQAAKLKEYKDELKELKLQGDALSGIRELTRQLDEYAKNAKLLKVEFSNQQEGYKGAKDKMHLLEAEYNNRQSEVQNLSGPLNEIKYQRNTLANIESQSSSILNHEEALLEYDPSQQSGRKVVDIDNAIDELGTNLASTKASRTDCINKLNLLVEHRIVESTPEDRHSISINMVMFETYYSDLQSLYENLDKSRESYKERLNAHNSTAATSAQMIENMKGIIEGFIHGINQELCHYQVSNLDKVELIADLHPQYTSMVSTLSRTSNTTDALLSEDFYTQIAEFQNQFYIQRSGKIDVSKIIEKITYQFERNGKREAIPQSNGTNCMVNAVVLALLLKEMVPEDLSLSIPVIFDEVGSLDEHNLSEVLKVMNEHGLVLFAANPESTGVIASVLEVFHDLSIFHATDVEVQGKAESIYFPGMEERLESIIDDEDVAKDDQGVEVEV